MRKYFPFICIAIIFIVVIISILFNKSKGVEQFIYYYDSYNVTSFVNENNYLNVNIYVNNKNSYFIDKSQVSDCYMKNKEDIIDIELISIHNTNEIVLYGDKEFYNFVFKFKINFDTSTNFIWLMNNVKLYMRYNNNKEYNLSIGDLAINKINKNDEYITISNIKPLISTINKNTYLTGLIIGLRKTINENITIKNIRILDANASIGNIVSQIEEIPESNSFDSIADFDYSSISKGAEEVNIKLNNDSIYLFIPIYYEKLIVSTSFPIEFMYHMDNLEYKYTLSNYTYFEPTNYVINEQELIICDIK